MTELSRSNRSYSGDLKTFTAAEKNTRKSSLMSVLKLLNLQKFLKYKMENIAACCAWCAQVSKEEGKEQSEQRRTQRTALMAGVWKMIKATANALCASWVFEWKYFPLILQTVALRSTAEYLPFHGVYFNLVIYFTFENRLYILLLKEIKECNKKLGLNSSGFLCWRKSCGNWVLDKPL